MPLLPSFGKQGVKLNLLSRKVDIEDTDYSSKFFVLNEYDPSFSGGKNAVGFNGSALLKDKSEIEVECLDSHGNSLFIELAKSVDAQYTDSSKFVISVHVYDNTYNGTGKLIFVGTTKRGEKVRWIGNITIDKTNNNISKVRFYYRPEMEVRALLYPVVDTEKAQTNYPPPPASKVAKAYAVISSYVQRIEITGTGLGYTSPTVTLAGGYGDNGSAASAYAVMGISGSIRSIEIIQRGNGYVSRPTVVINDPTGTGATANAFLRSEVTNVVITDTGLGYTFTPKVTFKPVGGKGADATAVATVVDGKVTAVNVTYGGDGYIIAPNVGFEIPSKDPVPDLNQAVFFTSSFYTYAADPLRDTNRDSLNSKRTDIDYRLVANISAQNQLPTIFPSGSFNSQMEGSTITLEIKKVHLPFTNLEQATNITQSFTIKRVLSNNTVVLDQPFFYTLGKNDFVANILEGTCLVNYRFILYNTAPDSNKTFTINPENIVNVKDSYAEIVYRNLKTYSGFVSRHKLYRKSSFSTGDFQLISDELLPSIELLSDPVTFNKFYDKMGTFYHDPHIEKYWFTSSNALHLEAKTDPINSMRIYGDDLNQIDGTHYVIAKNDSIGLKNDNVYHAYNFRDYNNLSGHGYNSNFISLKKNATYLLSFDVIVEKMVTTTAEIGFYFTSSIAEIKTEATYDTHFGMKIGSVSTDDPINTKYFNQTQRLFFTPENDYFGTIVIVPKHCNVILSNISLKVYGDHGFSPDVLVIQVPFSVRHKNEAYELKAELLDINSTVVFSNLRAVHSFDSSGASLYGNSTENDSNTVITVGGDGSSVTISGSLKFPDLEAIDPEYRFVAWKSASGTENDGKLGYTPVSELYIDSGDYIVLSEYQSGVETTAKSIAVRYNFDLNEGRKIFVDANGNKTTFR